VRRRSLVGEFDSDSDSDDGMLGQSTNDLSRSFHNDESKLSRHRRPHSTPTALSDSNQRHYSKRPQSSYLTSQNSRETLFQLKPSSFISSTDLSPATREINTVMSQWVEQNRILDVGIKGNEEGSDEKTMSQGGVITSNHHALNTLVENVDSDIDKLLRNKNTSHGDNKHSAGGMGSSGTGGKRPKNANVSSGGMKRKNGSNSNSSYSRQSVEQRIEKIRNDKLAKKRLLTRIAEHEAHLKKQRKEKRINSNSIQKYVKKVSADYSYESIQREKMEYMQKWNSMHESVLENHEHQQMALRQHLEDVWAEGVRKREYAEFKRATLPILKRNAKRQRMWFPAVILASTVSRWSRIMLEKRVEREYLRKRERAKNIIKKYVLPQVFERRAQRRERAVEVLKSNMLLWALGHRVRKKKSSVRVIVSCIGSLQDSNRFSKQVAIFLHHVKTSQKAMKKHLEKRNGQLFILRKYWEKVEVEFLLQQKKSDLEEYREKLVMEVEQLVATIEGNSLDPSKAQSVKQSMKKTKVVVIQSKKILKKAIDAILSKEEIKKQIKANANLLLEKMRTKGELSAGQLEKLGRILSVFRRERFPVLPHIRDQLILRDIIKRSKTHRELVAVEMRKLNQEKEVRPVRDRMEEAASTDGLSLDGYSSSKPKPELEENHEPFYFRIVPSSKVLYENLILQAQQLSKEVTQKKAEMESAEADEDSKASEREGGTTESTENPHDSASQSATDTSKDGKSTSSRPTSAKTTSTQRSRPASAKSTVGSTNSLPQSGAPSKGLAKVAGSLDKKQSQMMRAKTGKMESPRLVKK